MELQGTFSLLSGSGMEKKDGAYFLCLRYSSGSDETLIKFEEKEYFENWSCD